MAPKFAVILIMFVAGSQAQLFFNPTQASTVSSASTDGPEISLQMSNSTDVPLPNLGNMLMDLITLAKQLSADRSDHSRPFPPPWYRGQDSGPPGPMMGSPDSSETDSAPQNVFYGAPKSQSDGPDGSDDSNDGPMSSSRRIVLAIVPLRSPMTEDGSSGPMMGPRSPFMGMQRRRMMMMRNMMQGGGGDDFGGPGSDGESDGPMSRRGPHRGPFPGDFERFMGPRGPWGPRRDRDDDDEFDGPMGRGGPNRRPFPGDMNGPMDPRGPWGPRSGRDDDDESEGPMGPWRRHGGPFMPLWMRRGPHRGPMRPEENDDESDGPMGPRRHHGGRPDRKDEDGDDEPSGPRRRRHGGRSDEEKKNRKRFDPSEDQDDDDEGSREGRDEDDDDKRDGEVGHGRGHHGKGHHDKHGKKPKCKKVVKFLMWKLWMERHRRGGRGGGHGGRGRPGMEGPERGFEGISMGSPMGMDKMMKFPDGKHLRMDGPDESDDSENMIFPRHLPSPFKGDDGDDDE